MATTLKQIAEYTKLSIPTVHQILNGYNAPFAEATRQRVIEAAEKLNYRPNIAARSLVSQRSFLIGVLFYGTNYSLATQFMRGVQRSLRAHECSPVFLTHDSTAEEAENLQAVLDRRVDGLIVNVAIDPDATTNAARLVKAHAEGLPMVEVFGRFLKNIPRVTLDYRAAAVVAVQKLIAAGHTRIAVLLHENYRAAKKLTDRFWTVGEFYRGYLQAIEDAGLESVVIEYHIASVAKSGVAPEHLRFFAAYRALEAAWRNPESAPTALVCYASDAVEAAIRFCESHSARLPLTIATFGSSRPAISEDVRVLSFPLPAEHAGQMAGEMLFEQIEGKAATDVALGPVT